VLIKGFDCYPYYCIVLCLQLQRSGLFDALRDLLDIVFIDAPNPASGPVPDDVAPFFPEPYFEWWNAHKKSDGSWTYENAHVSLSLLEDVFKLHGPFDGVMGFSQGAGMAALISGMQRSGTILREQPPLRFVICFAGIRVRDAKLEEYYRAMRPIHSLHIFGDRDPIKGLTNLLIESFDSPVVIRHTRGHVIPALQGEDLKTFRRFLESHAIDSAM